MIQHTLSEIKTRNEKLAARHLRQLNSALEDAANAGHDSLWRECCMRRYGKLLALVHRQGVEGSLLDYEERQQELADYEATIEDASYRMQ